MRTVCSRASLVAVALLVGAVALTGCNSSNGSATGTTGRVQVSLTDQSGTYSAVVLSIKKVLVVPDGMESADTTPAFHTVANFTPSRVVDVLDLAYQQQLLGEATMPAGEYHQVRLVLDTNPASGAPLNYVMLPGDTAHYALDTPSGHMSGLKVTGDFTVMAGYLVAMVLDFNPQKAIIHAGASGKYILKPTGIRMCEQAGLLAHYGSLSGTVLPSAAWSTAVVRVVPVGSSSAVVSGAVDPEDGSYRALVPAGSYNILVDATGFAAFDSRTLGAEGTHTVMLGQEHAVEGILLTR
ncbi:MAG: DUF4382 domain-containing protein [Armatimonadetes bacterium]|nr:DUF4382 domain-containing protein [Armatimonadota bacterium]